METRLRSTKSKVKGKRHLLLYYKHTMDRLWRLLLLVDIALWITWGYVLINPKMDSFVYGAAIAVLVFMLFALLARRMGYVQAYNDHIRIVTPFLRLKIGYRRLKSARPMEFVRLFPPKSMNWGDTRFAEPYFKKTVVALLLNGYPLSPALLRFFLPPMFFLPNNVGFVLVLRDWMGFNTEIDSFVGTWRESSAMEQRFVEGSGRGMF